MQILWKLHSNYLRKSDTRNILEVSKMHNYLRKSIYFHNIFITLSS